MAAEGDAGVVERLDDGEVGIGQRGVLTDDRDLGHVGLRVGGVHAAR